MPQFTAHTAHKDTYIRDNMPPESLWPEMDYGTLPELAAYPARMNVAAELLDKAVADGRGGRPYIYFGEKIWSYSETLSQANRLAHVLVDDYGLVPGERVLLRSGNHPMIIIAWFAILKAGGIAIATMPVLRERELVYMIGKARIQLAICDNKLSEDIEKAKKNTSDLRRILYFGMDNPDSLEARMVGKSADFKTVDTAAGRHRLRQPADCVPLRAVRLHARHHAVRRLGGGGGARNAGNPAPDHRDIQSHNLLFDALGIQADAGCDRQV